MASGYCEAKREYALSRFSYNYEYSIIIQIAVSNILLARELINIIGDIIERAYF